MSYEKARNERTKMTNEMLENEVLSVLNSITAVVTDMIKDSSLSLTGLCENYGLDCGKIRHFLLNIENYRSNPDKKEISKNIIPEERPYEKLYCEIMEGEEVKEFPIDLEETIDFALTLLTQRESTVVRLYYGLDDIPMTLTDIGAEFRVTKDRISQIRMKAIRKLKHPSRKDIIKEGKHMYQFRKDEEAKIFEDAFRIKEEQVRAEIKENQSNIDQQANIFKIVICTKNTDIDQLELSVRSYNSLKRAGIKTIYDLLKLDNEKFYKIRNLGKNSITEIEEKFIDYVKKIYGVETESLENFRITYGFDEMDIDVEEVSTESIIKYLESATTGLASLYIKELVERLNHKDSKGYEKRIEFLNGQVYEAQKQMALLAEKIKENNELKKNYAVLEQKVFGTIFSDEFKASLNNPEVLSLELPATDFLLEDKTEVETLINGIKRLLSYIYFGYLEGFLDFAENFTKDAFITTDKKFNSIEGDGILEAKESIIRECYDFIKLHKVYSEKLQYIRKHKEEMEGNKNGE